MDNSCDFLRLSNCIDHICNVQNTYHDDDMCLFIISSECGIRACCLQWWGFYLVGFGFVSASPGLYLEQGIYV